MSPLKPCLHLKTFESIFKNILKYFNSIQFTTKLGKFTTLQHIFMTCNEVLTTPIKISPTKLELLIPVKKFFNPSPVLKAFFLVPSSKTFKPPSNWRRKFND